MAVTANNKPAMIERRKRFAFIIFGMQGLYGDGTNKEVNVSIFVEYYTIGQKGKSRKIIRSRPASGKPLPAGPVRQLHIKESAPLHMQGADSTGLNPVASKLALASCPLSNFRRLRSRENQSYTPNHQLRYRQLKTGFDRSCDYWQPAQI